MGRKTRWTDDQLREAVAQLRSLRSVLIRLGLRPLGGNYSTVRRRIMALTLPTTHWTGQGWLRGQKRPYGQPRALQDILQPGTQYPSAKLKSRLIRAGVMETRCASCLNSRWLGNPIPLELDHIDGDTANNQLGNLRLLCPNCHALTPTYRARNARYPHIPPIAEIERGIEACGGLRTYAKDRGVSAACVRGWLRSARLRRSSKVGENVAEHARVVKLVDTGDLI